MNRSIAIALALLALSAPSFADVTVKSTGGGKGMGVNTAMTTTTYIKGNKMRTDSVVGDTTRSMIFDVDNQRLYSFDSKKREVSSWNMQEFSAQMTKSVDTSGMKASVKPNGQTKVIAGKTASGYDIAIEVPATLGQNGMKMTVMMNGPMWVVKGAPGTAEYLAFYKGALEKGFIFSDPRGAKGSPGQAKATAEMYKQLLASGGIPYETEFTMKMGGDGPMAAAMAKMGGMSMISTVESVATGALAADLFAPPAGYKLTEQK